MMLMIREGTSAKNLEELLPLVQDATARRFCFVSDDLHPRDIQRRGHLDFMISKAISLGLNPATAVQLATLNPAEYFGLKGQGAVAPGYRADLVVLDNLEHFKVEKVYKAGRLVVDNGELVGFPRDDAKPIKRRPLNIPPIRPESFRIPGSRSKARIIQVTPGKIVTGACFEQIHLENGLVVSDVEKDVLKLAVVERHRATGRIGLGLVRGFALKKGAMASSVAHDSHNVIAVGVGDSDLCLAVQEVQRMGGGMAVVENNAVCASVPLELAGLMSLEPLAQLTGQLDGLDRAASSLGCLMPEPFMQLSFLALPVIPELKLTDHGLVDVNKFSLVPLFVDDI
jgi:adenine deaminase